MRKKRRKPYSILHTTKRQRSQVPRRLWKALAAGIAAEHGMTVRAMLFEDRSFVFFIPRAKFWCALRSFKRRNGKPRYSLPAIAAVTGHHHTTILSAIKSLTIHRDYASVVASARREIKGRRDLTGQTFGKLTVTGRAPTPEGKDGRWWYCRCSCGQVTTAKHYALTSARKVVCGINHFKERHQVKHLPTTNALMREQRAL